MRGILTYHSIDSSGSAISVAPEAFAAHVRFLASGRIRVVGLEEIAALPEEEDAVAITFDDGYENFAKHAWPLLRQHRLPATVFVVTDRVGGTNAWDSMPGIAVPSLPLLGWEQLVRLDEEGVKFGSHGRSHVSLVGLPRERLKAEVAGSRDRIRAETGIEPAAFAYPFGDLDEAAVARVRPLFSCACTARWSLLGRGDDPHLLPRLDAYYFRSNDRLESFGSRSFRRWLAMRGAARRVGTLARRLAPSLKLGKAGGAPTMDGREGTEP